MIKFPQSFEGKKILIAGAAGFIPSTLSEKYLNLGAQVTGVDNFITGSKSNIEILNGYSNFDFVEADISQPLPQFKQKFDYIFQLASPASPIDFSQIPLEIMKVNAWGTCHLLELAKDHQARILVASTSEVYGDPEVHPQVESYVGHVNTIGPRSCYDEAKRFAEAMAMNYHWKFSLETRLIRIFNTYGPRMRPNDGRVIPNFINQALKNEKITVNGDGSQTRSFCYVTDLIEAMHNVMFSDDPTPFNIGNPDEYSILEAAKIIIKELGSSSEISFRELPKDDPKKRRPNIDKLQKISDYRPQVSFEEGLKQTAEYFKNL